MSDEAFCSPLLRAAIIVSDLQKSLIFYQTLFGFAETYSFGDSQSDLVAGFLGRPSGTVTKFFVIKQKGPNFGMIGLFQLLDPAPPRLALLEPSVSIGESVLVFFHNRFDWLIENVSQYGGKVLVEPSVASTPFNTYREMVLADPDGAKLVIMERDPKDAFREFSLGKTL